MTEIGDFSPTEVFECENYIYALDRYSFLAYVSILQVNFQVRPPARILDIGCGRGTMVKDFRSRYYEAYGIESRNVVPADGATLFQEDARRTHFPDGFFDVVTDRLTTLQLIDINKRPDVATDILLEAKRVTKPGGYFISRTSEIDLREIGINRIASEPLKTMSRWGFSAYRF